MEQSFWIEQQNQNIARLGQNVETYSQSTRETWKHFTSVLAGILAISIPLALASGKTVGCFLIAAWVLQLVAVGLGLAIIKLDIDREFWEKINQFRFAYDMNELNFERLNNPINQQSKKNTGILLSVLYEKVKELPQANGIWTKEAVDLINKYRNERPSCKIMADESNHKKSKPLIFFNRQYQKVTKIFYGIIFLALALFLIGGLLQATV